MSNELSIFESGLPAHLSGKTSALAESLFGGISVGGLHRISVKGNRFRLKKGQEEIHVVTEPYIDVVLVGAAMAVQKTFYVKKYVAGAEPEAPDCYSVDGVSPAADSKQPQAKSCATCPQNVWGSRVTENGKQGKLCADSKRIAVMHPTKLGKDDAVWQLSVPAASLKNLATYARLLAGRGVAPEAVVTRVSLDTDSEFPLLDFKPVAFLSEAQYTGVMAAMKERVADIEKAIQSTPAQAEGVVEERPVKLVEQPKAAAAKAKPAPAPKEEPKPEPAPELAATEKDELAELIGSDWT